MSTQSPAAKFDHKKYRAFAPLQKADRRWPNQIIESAPQWCSVDLRDGNQALIDPMTVAQKKTLWALLIKMGFKHIEVGFPSASQTDYDFVRWLIEQHQIPEDVTIQVLTQARDHLIERTFESLQDASKAIVHVYNSTSKVQRDKVFGLDKQGIIDIACYGAKRVQQEAKKYPQTQWQFEYSPESFSGTEIDFAVEISNAVLDIWQPTSQQKAIINLPATVESSTPNVFADQIEYFCEKVQQRENVIISVHTHNDRGCAVAAAELAVMAGADRVEGTLFGNGERTGNMDIITMAMNLYSQGVDPQLNLANADEITHTVEACTNIKTHARHPWFGELVYTAFSGSHQDAIKKCLTVQEDDAQWDVAYLPINPQDLGRDYQSVIRVNSQSGKGGIAYLLQQDYQLQLPRWMQIEFSQIVQSHSEQLQAELNSQQIYQLFNKTYIHNFGQYQLASYQLDKQGAVHSLQASISDGHDLIAIHGQGDGAISAFCDGLNKALGLHIDITHYDQHAIGEGSDAQAIAYLQKRINGQKFISVGKDQDVISASLNAILHSLNQRTEQHAA